MFDLEGKNIRVNNPGELNCLFEYANKHGWKWGDSEKELNTSFGDRMTYPFAICFNDNKKIYWGYFYNSNTDFKDIEKYLKPEKEIEKEMTAREFVGWIADAYSLCSSHHCSKCVLGVKNTGCSKSLCHINNWKYNIDKLLEIAALGRITVPTPEEKAIGTLESFIENPDRAALNDEFVDALKLAVEKLKEVK